MFRKIVGEIPVFSILVILFGSSALAQEGQDDVSKALDSTATQWSLQTAYQVMPDYHSDEISPGATRRTCR